MKNPTILHTRPGKFPVLAWLVLLAVTALSHTVRCQDVLRLGEVIAGHVPLENDGGTIHSEPVYVTDEEGGTILIPLYHTKANERECSTRYRFDWRFWDPVTQLDVGQAVWVEVAATTLQTDCRQASLRARLTADTGKSDAFTQKNLRDIAGIKVVDDQWVVADSTTRRMYYQIKTSRISGSYASLKLQFEYPGPDNSAAFEFELVYVFIPLSYGGTYRSLPSDGLEAPPSYKPDPFDGSDVPPFVRKEWLAKLEVDSWSFFSGPRGSLKKDALPKATSFNRDNVNNIYWEMTLRSSSPSPGADVEVECVYHDRGGDFLAKDRFTMAFPKDRDSLKFWGEFAMGDIREWSPSTYSMEVLLDGRFVEKKEFEVEH